MRAVFADTSYWIALLNPRDELHPVAKEISRTLGSTLIVTSEAVLTELLNCFAERGPILRGAASRTVESLQASPSVRIVHQASARFAAAFQLYQERLDKSWSLTDCSSFLIMRDEGIEAALTYDKHFEQASFTALLRSD